MVIESSDGLNFTSHEYVPAMDFVASLMGYLLSSTDIIVLSFFHMVSLSIFSDILHTISSSWPSTIVLVPELVNNRTASLPFLPIENRWKHIYSQNFYNILSIWFRISTYILQYTLSYILARVKNLREFSKLSPLLPFFNLFLTSLRSSIILFQDSNVTTYFIFTTLDMWGIFLRNFAFTKLI